MSFVMFCICDGKLISHCTRKMLLLLTTELSDSVSQTRIRKESVYKYVFKTTILNHAKSFIGICTSL